MCTKSTYISLLKINGYFNNGLVTGVASMLGPFCQSGQFIIFLPFQEIVNNYLQNELRIRGYV